MKISYTCFPQCYDVQVENIRVMVFAASVYISEEVTFRKYRGYINLAFVMKKFKRPR